MLHLFRIAGAVISATLAFGAGQTLAQDYPSKPIRLIVPSSAGTTADVLARAVGAEMAKILGQPVLVEDKPGANQAIALEIIAKAPADGYIVGMVGIDGVALLPLISKNLRFDPMADLVQVASVAESRYVLAGPAARSWKTFKEITAYIKANPGKLNYGSSAPQVRFPVLVMIQDLGLDIVHIPYSGGGPYLTALAAGTVDMGIAGEGTAQGLGDRVQFFAVTGQKRMLSHPNVPTFAELGIPRVHGPAYAINVRTGTPRPIVDKLSNTVAVAMERPEVKAALGKLLLEITYEKSDAAAKKLAERAKFYAEFAKRANMTPE